MQAGHITVCICTFKRPDLLTRALDKIGRQATQDRFAFSVVVADNDADRSAELATGQFARTMRTPVKYCVQPQQNIALVRNTALQHADGDLVAFIDDDEVPGEDWLLNLFNSLERYGADGTLGPVKPYFEHEPPRWVTKGRFFERPSLTTGTRLKPGDCRTGNVLFKKSILAGADSPFRAEFGTGGEDSDFFRRMIDRGGTFVWCDEAVVYELVPPGRCRRGFLLKRALLRGSNFPRDSADRVGNILKSIIAVPSYALALPVLLICGQHLFLKYLFKLCDHASRLLACIGWRLVATRASE